jgi:autotransporter translocation and assembly factor TamB
MRLRTALLIIFSVIFTALIIGGIVFLRSSYFLHYIRVTIEDRLEKQFKQSLLFSLRSELQRDMEGSQLSSDLRRAFEANGISFSKQVKLSVREKDSEWLITDRDKNAKFIVRKEAKQLNVYKNLVKFGDFSGDILTGVTITEFEIADKHPQNPPLISADEIELKYNLWGLLRGRLFIINLTINKPELNIHTQPDGRLNVTDLVREKNGGSSGIKIPFWSPVLDVKVDDGTVNFKENKRDLTVTIGGIDIDFEGPLEEWDHSGTLTVEGKDFELNGVETKIDNFTVKFKLPEDKVELTEFHLEFGDSFLTGSCTVSDLKGKSPDINATANLTLDLQDLQRFLNDSYNMEGKVEVDDIEARGTLSNLKGNFELNLPLFTLNEHELKNLTTTAMFTQDTFKLTEIRGTLASGAVTGDIELRKAEIPSAEGTTTGGLAYQGQLELAGSQADELVPMLNILPEDFPVLKGDVHGKIEFSGNSVHSDDLKMSGDLQLDRATLNDEDLHASAAHWQIEADQLHLSANFDASQIQLDGAFGLASQQDLALKIEQIDVGKLTRIFRVLDVAGDGTLTAKIDHEAKMTGLFRIPDVSINKVPSGVLTADFLYEAGNLLLQPMRLSKENSEITLNGDVLLEGPMPVKLAVDVQPLYIPDHVKLLSGDDYPIEGVATGALALDGTLEKLDARGRLEIVEGKMWDLALDTLTLPLEIEDYVLKISGFELLSRQQRSTLDFQFKMESGDYELAFQSEPMRLAELAIASGVTDFQLDGDVIVKATGNANASDPLVDVTADFSDITYAGHPLRDVYITGVFKKDAPEKEGALKFEGVGFDGASQITGTLWAAEESPYQIFVENVGLDITPFLPIFYNGLEKTWPALNDATGTANGTLEIAGTLVDLTRYTLKMYVPQLSLHVNGQELINSDRIELSFEDDVWKVHSLTLADVRTPDALLIRANGEFTVQRITEPDSNPQRGQINEFSTLNGIRFVAESEGVALEHLASILGLPPTVSGDVAYQLIGNGTYDNPIFDLRWSLPNLSIETLQASIVPSIVEEKSLSRPISEAQGQLLYKNRKLTVESFDFLLLGNRVTVQGDVQVDTDAPQSTVFNLQSASPKFRLDSLETSLLPSLSHLDGLLNIQLHLAGTAATPKLTGTIIGTEATMQVLDFPHPIEKMNFDLQIASGDNASDTLLAVALKSADWQVGERPYKASGSWQLSKTGSQSSLINLLSAPNLHDGVNFQLALEGREVNLKHFVDYLWSTDAGETETAWKIPLEAGEVDLSLSVQGDGYSPAQISSQLTCDNLLLNVNGHEVTNIDPIRFRFADAKLHIESLEVGEAWPEPIKAVAWFLASGNIDVNGNLELNMKLTEPPFTVLMPGLTVPLFNTAIWLKGSLESNISIGGNLSNPIIHADWQARSRDGEVEEVADANYKDQMLTIEYSGLTGYDNPFTLSGDIPIDLAFTTHFADRFLDRPIKVEMGGQDVALDFLHSFHPQLEGSKGTADVNFNISGTTASPYLKGDLSVRNAELKLIGFDTPIQNGKLDVKATTGRIDIPTLSFEIGKGRYTAKMHFQMNGLFPTQFEVDQFTANNAQISDFARNFLSGDIASNLKGYVTSNANLRLPMDQFIVPGETAWIPQKVTFNNLNDLLKAADGELKIQNILIDILDYEIRNSNTNPIKIAFEDTLTLKGFTLEDQQTGLRFTGFGNFDFTNRILFNMDIENFDLAFLSDFVPNDYTIQGVLDASLDIRGTAIQPIVIFKWNIPQRSHSSINRAKIDKCSGQIVYYDDKLYISKVPSEVESAPKPILTIGTNNHLYLSGIIPFRLSLLEFTAKPLPQDIEGRLDIEIGDFGFLPDILDPFHSASGTGNINASISGQLGTLKLLGRAQTEKLAFDMLDVDSRVSVKDTKIYLTFTHEELQIKRFEGKINEGTYRVSGSLKSNWHQVHDMDIEASADGCNFKLPNYEFRCGTVNLKMKGNVERDGAGKLPPLTGNVPIEEGKYKRHWKELVNEWLDKPSEMQYAALSDYPILRDLQFDIELNTLNNLQVESDLGKLKNLEAEIVRGRILGPVQKPIFKGRINLVPGGEISFFVIDYPFTLTEGSYIENKSGVEFKPRYEIFAETARPIRGVSLLTTDSQLRTKDIHITAEVIGDFNQEGAQYNPVFDVEVLRKDGEEFLSLDQKEILAILTPFGDISTLNADTFSSDFARPFFLRSSQRYVGSHVARIAGLSDFWFDLSADTPSESRIHLTRQVAERLFLTYSSTFQLHSDPRIEVEYQINRRISIKGERNDQGKYGLDLELEMRF